MAGNEFELHAVAERLRVLEKEKKALLKRQQSLLAGKNTTESTLIKTSETLSTDEKVALFSDIFRGRDDIFAQRWENTQGRSGYGVACGNEWQRGLCRKPKIKCGDCPHQAFLSLDADAVYEHLSGKCTLGLYPLLENDHCWLLAVDFDKSDWQTAVGAFREACEVWELPHAVERSRSGNGAHVWLFFQQPVPAVSARQFGFALLDKAMEAHPSLSFDSYDRLIPNQDVMPAGGFGNLIALPLQFHPRQCGNSVFIDHQFNPYKDQWAYLKSMERIPLKRVLEHQDIGSADRTVDETLPWEKNLPHESGAIAGSPDKLELVLANRIYVKIAELPPILVARLRRIARFSNPVFFKTQALRFSTHGIPRFICLAQIEQGFLALPRGCIDDVLALLVKASISVTCVDKRQTGKTLSGLQFNGTLRTDQKKAVTALNKHEVGVLHAPTAFGKTVTAIGLIHKRAVSTLILVHSRQLLDQWRERLNLFLCGCAVGVIGGGKRAPTGEVDVATYQSLINRRDNTVSEQVFDYGQVIIDECHHISAPNYEAVLNEVHAKYVVGVTATPHRQDGHQPIVFMLAGPIRHTVKSDTRHQFEQRVVVRRLNHALPDSIQDAEKRVHIADLYRALVECDERNEQIIDDVVAEVGRHRHPIVLTERRGHALVLAQLLAKRGVSHQVLRGAMSAKERTVAMAALDTVQVLIATGKYIGEGFDMPVLDTLFLALPISWKGTLAQYAGRIHRQSEGKVRVTIYDYVDDALPTVQRMFRRRSKAYKALGYSIVEDADEGIGQGQLGFLETL